MYNFHKYLKILIPLPIAGKRKMRKFNEARGKVGRKRKISRFVETVPIFYNSINFKPYAYMGMVRHLMGDEPGEEGNLYFCGQTSYFLVFAKNG